MPYFAHLHLHTLYSVLDGASKIPALMQKAAEFGMDAVAITDHGNMYGVMEFVEAAAKAGIKPRRPRAGSRRRAGRNAAATT